MMSPADLDRFWRRGVMASMIGVLYSVWCITEPPRVKYLTDLGFTAFHFGVIAGMGSLAVVFQVVSGMLASRIARRKPWWMAITITHRLLFSTVLITPWFFADERTRVWWIVGIFFLHDALAHTSAPLWLSWMADLLPTEEMNRRWASRQRAVTISTVVAALVGGVVMGQFEKANQVILGFTIISLMGIAAGVADVLLFWKIPEPPNVRPHASSLREMLTQPLRDPRYRAFVKFGIYWHATMMIAGPFFQIYFIKSLKLPVFTAQMLNVCSFAGTVLSSGLWGILCDTYGHRAVMRLTLVLKSVTLLAITFTPPVPGIVVPGLAVALFFDGVLNAGIGLAWQGIMLNSSPRRNRAMYIGAVNFLCVGVAGFLAPILSGRIIFDLNARGVQLPVGPYVFNAYHLMFVASVLLRGFAMRAARHLPSEKAIEPAVMLRHLVRVNVMGILWDSRRAKGGASELGRVRAARRLGERRSPLGIPALIDALRDPSATVREAAASALGRIGTADAAAPLARVLTDPELGLQSPAARALGQIGSTESLQALLANLRRLDPRALRHTVDALARIGDSAAILPLICLLDEHPDPQLRQRIATALSRITRANTPQEIMELLGPEPRAAAQG